MRQRVKKIGFMGTLALVLTLVLGIGIITTGKISAGEKGIHTQDELRIHFNRMTIKDTNKTSRITKSEAIQIANKNTGYSDEKIKVYAQYVIMTNEDVLADGIPAKVREQYPQIKEKGYLYEVPVWIISYEGLKLKRTKQIELSERNLVIDAQTGEIIYGFSYR